MPLLAHGRMDSSASASVHLRDSDITDFGLEQLQLQPPPTPTSQTTTTMPSRGQSSAASA